MPANVAATPSSRKLIGSPFGLAVDSGDEASPARFATGASQPPKHHRHTDFQEANLKNVLNAVAGLFVMCLYLYEAKAESGQLRPFPSLFVPSKERIKDTLITFDGWQCKL